MVITLRISDAENECGFFSEGGVKENVLKGFLERSDLSVHTGANGAIGGPVRVQHRGQSCLSPVKLLAFVVKWSY